MTKNAQAEAKSIRRAVRDSNRSREEDIHAWLADQIEQRQEEIGMGNMQLANELGCKWDTIVGFKNQSRRVDVIRYVLMLEAMGGSLSIKWKSRNK